MIDYDTLYGAQHGARVRHMRLKNRIT